SLRAIATDNHGLNGAGASTALTVLPNAEPTVGAVQVPTSTVTLGNTVTLSVTAGDIDGTITSVNFYNGDVLLGAGTLSIGNTYTSDWTPSVEGGYSLTATGVDNTGLIKESDTLTQIIVIEEDGISPTIDFNIISTNDSSRYVTGSQLSISVYADDPDGDNGELTTVLYINGEQLSLSSDGSAVYIPSTRGDYNVVAIAIDADGNTTTTSSYFAVESFAILPIVAISEPTNKQVYYLGDEILVRAKVDAPGKSIASVFLSQSGKLVERKGGNAGVDGFYEFTVAAESADTNIPIRVGASYIVNVEERVETTDNNGNVNVTFRTVPYSKVGLSEATSIDIIDATAPAASITVLADGDNLVYGST
ncbi:MAG: Ig-like domain-containing protein, partial [Verrucomicrobiota bacterium]|nr:Ig-like domain-containing protein [Verrucomicrobiota bacterium]